jgi:hypothetical protein
VGVTFISEELTELNIQLETGSETEQDLTSSLEQAEGEDFLFHFFIFLRVLTYCRIPNGKVL